METTTPSSVLFDLSIDATGHAYLKDAARWAKFLAIMGFIFCGLFVVLALLMGSIFSQLSTLSSPGMTFGPSQGGLFTGVYLVLALLYFFPCLLLLRFATRMQEALRNNDQERLNQSFKNLRAFYRFIGVLMIIGIGIWVITLVFVAVFSATRMGAGRL